MAEEGSACRRGRLVYLSIALTLEGSTVCSIPDGARRAATIGATAAALSIHVYTRELVAHL